MGKIGDYIHLRRENYNNGLKIRDNSYDSDENKKSAASIAIQTQHEKMKNMISKLGNANLASEMETKLNDIFDNQNDLNRQLYQAMIKEAEKHFPAYKDAIENILTTINPQELTKSFNDEAFNKMTVESSAALREMEKILKDLKQRITVSTKEQLGKETDIISKIQGVRSLNNISKSIGQVAKTDMTLVEGYNKALKDAQLKLKSLFTTSIGYKKIDSTMLSHSNKIVMKFVHRGGEKDPYMVLRLGDIDYRVTMSRIESALDALDAYFAFLAIPMKVLGEVAEYALGGLAYYIDSQERIPTYINKYVTGEEKSFVTYNSSRFASFGGESTISVLKKDERFTDGCVKGNTKYLKIKGTATQDKIDVFFSADTVERILGSSSNAAPDNMRMSVKNYSLNTVLSQGFGGVSGSAFLYLIQLQDVNFINHWINLTITHEDDSEFNKNSVQLIEKAHQEMIQTLIIIGAVGGTLKMKENEDGGFSVGKQGTANYLVWRRRIGGKDNNRWHVYAMNTLLSPIQNSAALDKYVEGYDFKSNSNWKTERKNAISDRIEDVLLLMHQRKITTHTPNLLWKTRA